jgi:uncharacterized Zn-binding protein involved in type VI secretion
MPTYRRLLRSGDVTSTNGVLIASGELIRGNLRVAVEGDYATCPACERGGVVFNTCRPAFMQRGRRVLVHGAYVNCLCNVKPMVLSSQGALGIEVQLLGIETSHKKILSEHDRLAAMQVLLAEARRVTSGGWVASWRESALSLTPLDNIQKIELNAARAVREGLMRIKAITSRAGQLMCE